MGKRSDNKSAMPIIGNEGSADRPIDRKNPIRKMSLKRMIDLASSPAFGSPANSMPNTSAPRSAFIPTSSKRALPEAARMIPARIRTSSCPLALSSKLRSGRAKYKSGKDSAQIAGTLPVEALRKITATMSWTIRMPTASWPWRTRNSPRSSNIATAQTVELKLRAKATSTACCQLESLTKTSPKTPSSDRNPTVMRPKLAVCSRAER